jgi:predicted lipid-binding transport protein (Tim44 family)
LKDKEDEALAARKTTEGAEAQKPPLLLGVAPASLAGGLERVKQLDASFDEKQFLRNTLTVFTNIVASFAKGDLTEVATLLGPSVRARFEAAIAARKQADETLTSRIETIRDVETTAADVEDTRTVVSVRIVSDQENILRDAAGKILSGEEGTVEEITDAWVFSRDTKATTPDWQLVETRS